MKYAIAVKTNAKQVKVEETGPGELRVQVKAPPREGRANEAVIEAIAGYFRVPKSRIVILAGHASKRKIVRVGECGC